VSQSKIAAVKWQLALVLWGDKYPDSEVNALIDSVLAYASHPPRIVMITDRNRAEVHSFVEQRPFPDFYMNPSFLQGGCQAKLAMFSKGVLPDDLPTIFLDIDTMVLGDMTKFLQLQKNAKSIVMFHSAGLPFGLMSRKLADLSNKSFYARGNSSIVVFQPSKCFYISEQFMDLFYKNDISNKKPLSSDDRFISWVAQEILIVIPKYMAVKFPTEFMLPFRWLIYLRGCLPWNIQRWSGLLAITFPGMKLKGQDLVALPDGAEIIDKKGRRLIWSSRALGPVKEKITLHYQNMVKAAEAER
jgi:hypothetical protein